ncbi:hypothetical protein HYT45_03140 [Candidatus Uhrbacteria bacterium]|nr:hypothetical protein [Candidatus Uhrbacteria bacterium]
MAEKIDHHHRKVLVKVGNYEIFVGGSAFIKPGDLEDVDIVIPINAEDPLPMVFGCRYDVLCGYNSGAEDIKDKWANFINKVVVELQKGKKIFAYCFAGHGRTGMLLASLVAVLESEEASPDPIFAVRERYCPKAVESNYQAEFVFALRGRELPPRYIELGALLVPDDRFADKE